MSTLIIPLICLHELAIYFNIIDGTFTSTESGHNHTD